MRRLDDPLADASDQSPLIDSLQARRKELERKEKQNARKSRKLLCRQLGLDDSASVDVGPGGLK